MTQAILFMAIVPIVLLLVLLFALVSGYLSERTRVRVQWAMILTLYPVMILHFSWQAWERQQRADWFGVAIYLIATGILTTQFVLSLRSGALFPQFKASKA